MTSAATSEVGAAQPTFSSPAVVKRRSLSYGTRGILALTGNRLAFTAGDPAKSWEIAVSDIANLKKPWYGMGSYMTFRVNGQHYALAFGARGSTLATIPDDAAGDAIKVEAMAEGASIGRHWFSLLSRSDVTPAEPQSQ